MTHNTMKDLRCTPLPQGKNCQHCGKNWIIFNERHLDVIQDFDIGQQTPGRRCSILLTLLLTIYSLLIPILLLAFT
ncbi:hypothetical protein H5410_001223 [Solanum commersonii]|uniref:Uncharacterized protein n=1 Tax=Solanum commersonii TaxID=4109 RepID=A0A9J6AYZ2_SOLCO|nr:hypothetical protein H5410_001223 [Solanum commersonii]